MKDKEKEPVGSLLTKKALGDKSDGVEIILAGCVGLVLALILFIILFIIFITKWTPLDWLM